MRAQIEKNIGLAGALALALAVITLYSLWGGTLLESQRHAEADRTQVAINQ